MRTVWYALWCVWIMYNFRKPAYLVWTYVSQSLQIGLWRRHRCDTPTSAALAGTMKCVLIHAVITKTPPAILISPIGSHPVIDGNIANPQRLPPRLTHVLEPQNTLKFNTRVKVMSLLPTQMINLWCFVCVIVLSRVRLYFTSVNHLSCR